MHRLPPFAAQLTRLAAVLLVAACSSTDSPTTAPDFATGSSNQSLTVSPATLDIGWPLAQPTFVASVQYATTFQARSSNAACATVSPASALPVQPLGSTKFSSTFTVTPTGEGTCTITVTDKKGSQVAVTVSVAYPTLAFASHRTAGNLIALFTMKADGSGVTQLTFNPERDFDPEWSRDGSRIAFTSDRDGPTPPLNFEIYAMDATGGSQLRLTNDAEFDNSATWSPDGTKIAFASSRGDGVSRIYVMDADGTNPTALTTEQGQQPAWSPDGSQIAFAADRNTDGILILAMNADGSNQHRVTSPDATTGQSDQMPTWSPDGTRIAFASRRAGDGTLGIYTVNADGSQIAQLTHAIVDEDPSWSPDGSGIAYSSITEGDTEIFIMNADGSRQTRITHSPGEDSGPAWKP
jgi:Tol biopolymer transport system component